MEERTQMRGIPCRPNVDWQEPITHAFRAIDKAKKLSMFLDPFDEITLNLYNELVEEIENLYHSFYMR